MAQGRHCGVDRRLPRESFPIWCPSGRHAIHEDSTRLDDMRVYLVNGTADPLDLSEPRLIIDTTITFSDAKDIAIRVRDLPRIASRSQER